MSTLIARLRTTLARRKAFRQAVAEIAKIDARELADMDVHRAVLIARAREKVFGLAR